MTIKIWQGDVMDGLRALPADSVDCCVTSPPYWGLRDYGVEGQLGLEKSLGEHLQVMVRVFEEVRRVLKPEGTLWLNYGDCYATTPNGRSAADTKAAGKDDRTYRDKPFSTIGPINGADRWKIGANAKSGPVYTPDPPGADRRGNNSTLEGSAPPTTPGRITAGGYLKPKDLCMIPNRMAIALQEAGWWVRSEIVWAKPNPMPESVRDRPATAHEKIFLLTKSPKYYWNLQGSRRPATDSTNDRLSQDLENQTGSDRANGGAKTNGPMKAVGGVNSKKKQRGHGRRHAGFNDRWDKMARDEQQENGRHLRNYEKVYPQVWEFGTAQFSEAHFATFPPELVERCLRAGCPVGGLVLDPFGGAGTTGLVADYMGMHAHLIELNADYCRLAWQRIKKDAPMLSDIQTENFQTSLF